MGARIFTPDRQVAAFRRLADRGFITELTLKSFSAGNRRVWEFNLGDIELQNLDDGSRIDFPIDFCRYRFRVKHSRRQEPRIYLVRPTLFRKPHTWKDEDDRLCLYHPKLWQWKDEMLFDRDLFPQVYMWAFYTECWLVTGKWYGEETPHK